MDMSLDVAGCKPDPGWIYSLTNSTRESSSTDKLTEENVTKQIAITAYFWLGYRLYPEFALNHMKVDEHK